MKKILGLDLGTNSIGWALINLDFDNEKGNIIDMGSRIVPMDSDLIKNFEQGNSISRTANRRNSRGARRLKQRYKLRRERLIMTLKILGWIPNDFPEKFEGINNHNINDFLPFSLKLKQECSEFLKIEPDSLPTDWIIYYLRKKALTEKIELAELARVFYHFNQRRGFKSNRKGVDAITLDIDELESENKKPDSENKIEILKIINAIDTGELSRGKKVFQITTEKEIADGINTATIIRENMPEWENTEQELEVRIKRSKSGTRIELAVPNKTEWKKEKEAIEKSIEESDMHPGTYFLNQIKKNPNYRIKQRVIDRSYFQKELEAIWVNQKKHHPELSEKSKLPEIAKSLYKHNKQKQREIINNEIYHTLINDIIYYQRPLKSQKSSIGNCKFETKNIELKNKKGEPYKPFLKAAPVSCPLFQTFRIWKTIHTLKVFALQKEVDGQVFTDFDETAIQLNFDKKVELFKKIDSKEKITAAEIIKSVLGLSTSEYKLNFDEDTVFPGNETKHFFRKAFNRLGFEAGTELLENENKFNQLWHLFYSVEESESISKALIKHFGFPDDIAQKLALLPPFNPRYSAYSQKALRKLTALMKCGDLWNYNDIDAGTYERIQKIMDGEDDDKISLQTRELLLNKTEREHFQGLPEHLATYLVYGRHSERDGEPVENPDQIKVPEQNSLRNPIVEQVINETMQLTKAVWRKYGRPDEIRVEMARDMNRTAKEREKLSKIRDKNRDDKLRIKAILRELRLGNPDSASDIEKLRLLEENGNYDRHNYSEKFFKKITEPTSAEIDKYRLWIEQNCVSPYTGKPIMLSKLFTREYEVEHIIPRSRFFDDSLGNKVIVEAWANDEKGNQTAMQYIRRGSSVGTLMTVDDYIAHINKTFTRKKRDFLLRDSIPESFIERQKNDTRYIGKQVTFYLSQIVPQNKVRISSGIITNELKQKWGMNEMMKKLLISRFERLEKITGEKLIHFETTEQGQRKIILDGYDKRIDHRHHALDALITACTTNSHVQYLSTLSGAADPTARFKFGKLLKSDKTRDFKLPWPNFIPDSFEAMQKIIVSHKNRNRILSKGFNKYFRYVYDDGIWVKKLINQNSQNLYSIRKALHKETIAGTIKLRRYKKVSLKEALENIDFVADKRVKRSLKQLVNETGGDLKKIKKEIAINPLVDKNNNQITDKIVIWYFERFAVSREKLDESFTEKKIQEKIAEYDNKKGKGLKNLLLKHLESYGNKPKEAFTGEGLEALWKKAGHPIIKVSTYEPIGKKFEVRPGQLVESAKGTNLFFVIYENLEAGEREFETLGFNEVVAAKINKLPIVKAREGYRHFTLSPNDLVYIPDPDENIKAIDWNDTKSISNRIYKMVNTSQDRVFFLPHNVSELIQEKKEFGAANKIELDQFGRNIKNILVKIIHDRLGNIKPLK